MLKLSIATGLSAAALLAAPAHAATFVSVAGPASFAAPASAASVINFNVGVPAGLSGGYIIQSGSNGLGAAPFGSDGSRYLSVTGSAPNGPSATLMFGGAYSTFSLYWGSIDTYNKLELLDTAGNLIGTVAASTFTGIQVGPPANGAQGIGATNRRITFTKGAGDAMIGGIRLNSTSNSFEIDNVALGAVPEPATWAMMILGFGVVGGAMRARRRTRVAASFV